MTDQQKIIEFGEHLYRSLYETDERRYKLTFLYGAKTINITVEDVDGRLTAKQIIGVMDKVQEERNK